MTANRVLILSPDSGLSETLHQKLTSAGWTQVAVVRDYPTPGQLGHLILQQRPEIVLVGLSDPDYALSLIEDLHTTHPEVAVAATHSVNIPDLILAAIRSGASEYIGPPYEIEYLERVARERREQAAPQQKGRMVTVLPAGGGCGASTVALHLAGAIARQTGKKVLLIDWDLHCGSDAFRLRLKPEFTLAEACERSGALDEYWNRLTCSWKGIDLLPSAHPERVRPEDLGRIPAVLASAKRNYGWIVSDMPPAVHGDFERVLAEAETVYLVCTPDLVSLHLARRRVDEMRRLGLPKEAVQLIVNRDAGSAYKPDEIRTLVGLPVARALPSDPRAINAAWVEGRLVSEGSDFGRLIAKLAKELASAAEPAPEQKAASSWRPVARILHASPTA